MISTKLDLHETLIEERARLFESENRKAVTKKTHDSWINTVFDDLLKAVFRDRIGLMFAFERSACKPESLSASSSSSQNRDFVVRCARDLGERLRDILRTGKTSKTSGDYMIVLGSGSGYEACIYAEYCPWLTVIGLEYETAAYDTSLRNKAASCQENIFFYNCLFQRFNTDALTRIPELKNRNLKSCKMIVCGITEELKYSVSTKSVSTALDEAPLCYDVALFCKEHNASDLFCTEAALFPDVLKHCGSDCLRMLFTQTSKSLRFWYVKYSGEWGWATSRSNESCCSANVCETYKNETYGTADKVDSGVKKYINDVYLSRTSLAVARMLPSRY